MISVNFGRTWSSLGPRRREITVLALIALGLSARLLALNATTSDTQLFVLPWFSRLADAGYAALGDALPNKIGTDANYTPPYYYLLYFASLFDGLVPRLWLIKFVSIAFDAVAAVFAYRIVRLNFPHSRALIAAGGVFAAPSVILNGAWWGQCDIIWVSLILGSFYFTMARRPTLAVVLFAVALSFKAQAFFLAPFLFLLCIRGEISWWRFTLVPIVYIAMMSPAVALGQTWSDVFTVYAHQAGHFKQLSLNAPNLWYFISNDFYAAGSMVGLAATTIVCAALAFRGRSAPLAFDARALTATMFVALAAMLLPKMHDRYFFAADVFSIVLAVCLPRFWFVAAIFQITSLCAYVPIMTQSAFGAAETTPLPTAAMLNIAVVGFLTYAYLRAIQGLSTTARGMKAFAIAVVTALAGNVLWLTLTIGLAGLAARLCPASGLVNFAVCSRDLPANVIYGTWRHYLIYSLMFAPAFIFARFVVARAAR